MDEPVYDFVPVENTCYGVCGSKSQGTASSADVKVAAKKLKPANGCPVYIGLVLVGVVACVSMAVAVWSIAKVHNISNSCEIQKGDSEASNSDRIDNLNATLHDVLRIDDLNTTLVDMIDELNATLVNVNSDRIDNLNATLHDVLRIDDLNATLIDMIDELNATLVDVISNSCEAQKRDVEASAVVGLVNSDRINQVNATLVSLIQLSSFWQNSGLLSSVPATSCLQVSFYPSGYYWVRASNGSAVRVYCDTTRSCGGVAGGWMRVASLDFSNTSTSCPSGFQERIDSDIRRCGIGSSDGACPSVMFSTSGVEYTKVCGKILAYQDKTPDAFGNHGRGTNLTIDSNYVDGVSLTYGHTPTNHIWTFVAAVDEFGRNIGESVCECSNSQRSAISPPSFIGQDYFCDSALHTFSVDVDYAFFGDDPLWDGAGCGSQSTCCSFNNPPWFHKELSTPTSDNIEMRVCCDEGRDNEDIVMSSVEIYIQ